MLFSRSAKQSGGSGFFLNGDQNAPADCIEVSASDVTAANNIPIGASFDFDSERKLVIIPPPVLTADQIRANAVARKWEEIKAERDRRTENGGYKVGDHWYHSDAKSRSQQQDNEAVGSGLSPVEWKTMDGSFVMMTAELAAQIRAVRMSSDRDIFAVAESHRGAMEASADPAVYDFSGNWPKAYGEE